MNHLIFQDSLFTRRCTVLRPLCNDTPGACFARPPRVGLLDDRRSEADPSLWLYPDMRQLQTTKGAIRPVSCSTRLTLSIDSMRWRPTIVPNLPGLPR
jgi:hypothetical protein